MIRKNKANKPSPSTAVAYVRVSSKTQAEKGVSLDAQLAEIRRRAADRGMTIVRDFVERGESATDDHRPVFNEMMEYCFAPDAGVGTILVDHATDQLFVERAHDDRGAGADVDVVIDATIESVKSG